MLRGWRPVEEPSGVGERVGDLFGQAQGLPGSGRRAAGTARSGSSRGARTRSGRSDGFPRHLTGLFRRPKGAMPGSVGREASPQRDRTQDGSAKPVERCCSEDGYLRFPGRICWNVVEELLRHGRAAATHAAIKTLRIGRCAARTGASASAIRGTAGASCVSPRTGTWQLRRRAC
jgi:hypothetical protein